MLRAQQVFLPCHFILPPAIRISVCRTYQGRIAPCRSTPILFALPRASRRALAPFASCLLEEGVLGSVSPSAVPPGSRTGVPGSPPRHGPLRWLQASDALSVGCGS